VTSVATHASPEHSLGAISFVWDWPTKRYTIINHGVSRATNADTINEQSWLQSEKFLTIHFYLCCCVSRNFCTCSSSGRTLGALFEYMVDLLGWTLLVSTRGSHGTLCTIPTRTSRVGKVRTIPDTILRSLPRLPRIMHY
jgi:hypothetical protein